MGLTVMKVVAIQHVPHEPMGYIEEILKENDVEYEYVRVYEGDKPELGDATHIVIMGGPMGVYEEDRYTFLRDEKELIRDAFGKGIPVLGICLGAQLIASALGCEVYPYRKELGWFTVRKVENDFVVEDLPEELVVFQWHGDTFDLPENAKLLYAGDLVRNQAFRIGNAVGLQFHLEVTPEIVRDWVERENLGDEEKERILAGIDEHLEGMLENCRRLVNAFLRLEPDLR